MSTPIKSNLAPGPRGPVLLLCKHAGFGGTERIVQLLARALPAAGVSAQAVLPETAASAAVLAWFRRNGADAEASPAVKGRLRWRDVRPLGQFVRARRAEVANLHFAWSGIPLKDALAIRLFGRARCVASLHHVDVSLPPGHVITTRLAGLWCHAVVVLDQTIRDLLVGAGIPAHKVHVIPVGVPAPARRPGRSDARRALSIPQDAFVVSVVARLVPTKGVDVLIDALARLPDPESRLTLLVAGDGPMRPALEASAAEALGARARFLGRVDEPSDVYAASDVLAVPSSLEGVPLVAVEAAHHGVPTVGSDLPGLRGAVVDQETGLIVPSRDGDALRAAIGSLRADPSRRDRLGAAARHRAESSFSLTAMVEHYADLLAPDRNGPR